MKIQVHDKIRVLYGEHAGKHAQVVGIAECGHEQYDQLALVMRGATLRSDQLPFANPAPVFLFRFACEFVSREYVSAPKPIAERVRRFNYNNLVTVTNRALSKFGQTGRIIHVYDAPVEADFTGRASGMFHARYKVEFGALGFPHSNYETAELYDWELKLASDPLAV